jgi:hypothetical protein
MNFAFIKWMEPHRDCRYFVKTDTLVEELNLKVERVLVGEIKLSRTCFFGDHVVSSILTRINALNGRY